MTPFTRPVTTRRSYVAPSSTRSTSGALGLEPDDRRALAAWAAAAVGQVLPLFEAAAPGDGRPREALDVAAAYARGEADVTAARRASVEAHRAARETDDAAASAVARAAGHAAATAHMGAHARVVPGYVLRAVADAHPDDPQAARAAEDRLRADVEQHLPEHLRAFALERLDGEQR